jgi:hypothetical protein
MHLYIKNVEKVAYLVGNPFEDEIEAKIKAGDHAL